MKTKIYSDKEIKERKKESVKKYQKSQKAKDTLSKWREENRTEIRKRTLEFQKTDKYKKWLKEWKTENPEKFKEYMKKYRELNKEKVRLKAKIYAINNTEKIMAHSISKKITIPKNQKCEFCKIKNATQKHHEDYTKPLEVTFTCASCHKKRDLNKNERKLVL